MGFSDFFPIESDRAIEEEKKLFTLRENMKNNLWRFLCGVFHKKK
jgi:hypothetical protein